MYKDFYVMPETDIHPQKSRAKNIWLVVAVVCFLLALILVLINVAALVPES